MTEQQVLELLGSFGAILTNIHVCLTKKEDGWYHSEGYLAKDSATKHPWKAQPLYQAMAADWKDQGVEVVAGPAEGAIPIAHFIAFHLSLIERRDIVAVYLEPEDPADKGSPFILSRGFDQDVAGRDVLVVEDIFTSGGSAKRSVEAVRKTGGNVIGVAGIANRGGVTPEQVGNVPRLTSLTNMTGITMTTWPDFTCPLCKSLTPLRTDIGKGRVWLRTPLGMAWLGRGGTTFPPKDEDA